MNALPNKDPDNPRRLNLSRRFGLIVALGVAGLAWALFMVGAKDYIASPDQERPGPARGGILHVRVVHPDRGGMPRLSVQPGSIHAFEAVDLYAKVSGFLGTQNVDIGDSIVLGQVLAVIDVPEMVEYVKEEAAAVARAKAKAELAAAGVATARSELRAADAAIAQAKSDIEGAEAARILASKQLTRIKELAARKSVSRRLADEQQYGLGVAEADVLAKKAAVRTAEARRVSAEAEVLQAKAAETDSLAAIRLAKSRLDRARIMAAYMEILAPFDGVVTRRYFFPGDFIRSAADGAAKPILSVQRIDLMRVVVQIPDDDAVLLEVGDQATLSVDSLPGLTFQGAVSRLARSLDPATRTMRTEVDIPNPDGRLQDGMFGRVTIVVDPAAEGITIPPSCLVRWEERGGEAVFIVREGVAHLVPVEVGTHDGSRIEVTSGLSPDDAVVLHPGGSLKNGTPVIAIGAGGKAAS